MAPPSVVTVVPWSRVFGSRRPELWSGAESTSNLSLAHAVGTVEPWYMNGNLKDVSMPCIDRNRFFRVGSSL